MNSEKVSRKEVLPGFIAIITLAVIVYIAMELSAEKIADNQFIYSFGDLIGMNIEGGPMGRFLWFLTDLRKAALRYPHWEQFLCVSLFRSPLF